MKQFRMSKKFWKEVKPVIPQKRGLGRPRKGAKKIMRALFYILRTGIPWKALPSDFKVSSSTVHRRFQEWVETGIFREFWKKVLTKYKKNIQKANGQGAQYQGAVGPISYTV